MEATLEEFGQIDGLVLNHGTLEPVTRVGDSDVGAWKKGFDVNFFSAVAWVSRQLVRGLLWVQCEMTRLVGHGCTTCAAKVSWPHNLHFLGRSDQWLHGLGCIRRFEGCAKPSRLDFGGRGARCDQHLGSAGCRRYGDAERNS